MSNRSPWLSFLLLVLAAVVIPACDSSDDDDAAVIPSEFQLPIPFALTQSANGSDQLQSSTPGPDGSFYVAGFAGGDVTGPRYVTVMKLTSAGKLDTTFSGDGIAGTGVQTRGNSGEVGIATQSTGKIIVSATFAHAADLDNDIAVIRLNTDGTLDPTFDGDGIRIEDLNTAYMPGTVSPDAARGVAVDTTTDLIYVVALQRNPDEISPGVPRQDTDFTVVRFTADGALDLTYGGGDGKHLLDIDQVNATARGLRVFPGGSVIAGGYANTPTVLNKTQPVLYKLDTSGVLDPAFATGGVFHQTVLTEQTEVYNFAVHGANLVTGGYGRNGGANNVWVSLRFDTTTGIRDTTWGGAVNGAVLVDPSGGTLSNNCRNALALPNGKTLLMGSSGPSNNPTQDAAFAILDANGVPDTSYGDGVHTFQLGLNGNDQFWGAAVNAGRILIVGFEGGLSPQTMVRNDNAYAVLFDVR